MTTDQLQEMQDFLRRVSLMVLEADSLGRRLTLAKEEPAGRCMREVHAYLQGAESSLQFTIDMERPKI